MSLPECLDYQRSFSQVRKEIPKESESVSHGLLVKAGFVKQEMAGVFTLLPFGERVVQKIENIIREEMNAIGAQELTMPSLQPKENWQKTGRWDKVDVLFKVKSSWGKKEYVLGPTHEEIVTPLAKDRIHSYRDLPLALYQIQTKFRDEKRAKSGIIRGREFAMKDMYSFHANQDDLLNFYSKVSESYLRVFDRCGIKAKVTEASGGDFTKKFSHEFMAISPAGEDTVIVCPNCTFAQNSEIALVKASGKCPYCGGKLEKVKAIEIGNIFDLGRKFTDDFGVNFTDEKGKQQPVYMGCYGIGTTRLLGTVVELHHDEKGIVWPKEITPYDVHLIAINASEPKVKQAFSLLIKALADKGLSVLFDSREEVKAGEQFAVADAIGIPKRVIVSSRTIKDGKGEIKQRDKETSKTVALEKLPELLVVK